MQVGRAKQAVVGVVVGVGGCLYVRIMDEMVTNLGRRRNALAMRAERSSAAPADLSDVHHSYTYEDERPVPTCK